MSGFKITVLYDNQIRFSMFSREVRKWPNPESVSGQQDTIWAAVNIPEDYSKEQTSPSFWKSHSASETTFSAWVWGCQLVLNLEVQKLREDGDVEKGIWHSLDAGANFLSHTRQQDKKASTKPLKIKEEVYQSYSLRKTKIGDKNCQKGKSLGSQWGVLVG